MPIYLYEHPRTKKVIEVVQGMNDVHEYTDKKGTKWVRIFTAPQASIDTQIDPFSQQKFIDKTGAKNGTMGDIWDRAAELSNKRADIVGGKDPLKEKTYENYAKKRKGKLHPKQIIENTPKVVRI